MSTFKLNRYALAVAAFLAISPVAHANLIVNGSFENSSFGGGGGYTLGLVGNAVPGWYIPASDGTLSMGSTEWRLWGIHAVRQSIFCTG